MNTGRRVQGSARREDISGTDPYKFRKSCSPNPAENQKHNANGIANALECAQAHFVLFLHHIYDVGAPKVEKGKSAGADDYQEEKAADTKDSENPAGISFPQYRTW